MRIEIHHYHHALDLAEVLRLVQTLREELKTMNQGLQNAVNALLADVANEKTELASIKAYVIGVPGLTAAAVAKALSDNGVADDAAAASIEQARTDSNEAVQSVMDAVTANTPSEGSDTTSGTDTITGDDTGSDTTSGAGNDTIDGGDGNDSIG